MKVKINIHSIHFDADAKLLAFIHERIDKLSIFYDRIIEGDVFLKLENNNELANKVAEIKLRIPGSDLFAKKQSKSFEESIDGAAEALRKQLKKHKGKVLGVS
jgi:putative sigma-54 modulation protein